MEAIQNLEAVTYKDLSSVTKIFNLDTTEYYLWVHLPEEFNRDWNIYEVREMGKYNLEVKTSLFDREMFKPWVRFILPALNMDVGKHIYKIHLVNKTNEDVVALYFSYIIQNDNPKTPYIYMKE